MRARNEPLERGIETIGEVLARGLSVSDDRHPLIRSGDTREEIPAHIRSAVWYRDRGRCEHCGDRVDGAWELDHIYPWSAGGSNATSNLRVLCRTHNQRRSNHLDPTERPRLPATWWCINCCSDGVSFPASALDGEPVCSVHYSRNCGPMLGYRFAVEATGEPPTWFPRGPIAEEDATHRAFCAHCGRVGLTDRPL